MDTDPHEDTPGSSSSWSHHPTPLDPSLHYDSLYLADPELVDDGGETSLIHGAAVAANFNFYRDDHHLHYHPGAAADEEDEEDEDDDGDAHQAPKKQPAARPLKQAAPPSAVTPGRAPKGAPLQTTSRAGEQQAVPVVTKQPSPGLSSSVHSALGGLMEITSQPSLPASGTRTRRGTSTWRANVGPSRSPCARMSLPARGTWSSPSLS